MEHESLSDFVTSVSGEDLRVIEEDLNDGYVRLRVAEAERRQAKHDIRCVEDIVIEMLRNARDAHAKTIYVATTKSDTCRHLCILDDGEGIPAAMHEKVFEARVTSKLQSMVMDRWGVHGRGMALYSIKCNAESARVVTSAPALGSALEVIVDLKTITERSDQSTVPELVEQANGDAELMRGPHNIARTIVEFALESRGALTVFYGSPAEIAATMFQRERRGIDENTLLFCDDTHALPVCTRPAAAMDATELAAVCADIGLSISERTAHRIFAGAIRACVPPLDTVLHRSTTRREVSKAATLGDGRGLKIAQDDLATFSSALQEAFSPLAQRYFIACSTAPKVHVGKDCITVRFPFEKES